jgi:glycosyltransferase involved in cell wall biosynthesis
MGRPRFSIVIPTRERADTLRWALQTCLEQDFDDYEVVVCDNHSSPATREVVQSAASPLVRYVRAPRPLAMSANWELALGEATGEYVTVLGDDDGLLPYALREADALIHRHKPRALHWHRGLYTWPTLSTPEDANFLRLPLCRYAAVHESRQRIAEVGNYRLGADMLPMIYTAFVHRGVLARHQELTGRLFPNAYPDLYSAFGIAHVAGSYLSVSVPLNIAGLSACSNGMAVLLVDANNPIADEFFRLNRTDGYAPHPTVPHLPVPPVPVADSFQWAKELLFPRDDGVLLDRKQTARSCLETLPLTDPAARAEARRMVRASLADRPALQAWFDSEVPDPPPFRPRLLAGARLGYHGDHLCLATEALGVRTIADAVRLAGRLLGYEGGNIAYDLPPPDPGAERRAADLEARCRNAEAHSRACQARLDEVGREFTQLAARAVKVEADLYVREAELREARRACAVLEERVRAAEGQAALRHVPRRLARKLVGLVGSLWRRCGP